MFIRVLERTKSQQQCPGQDLTKETLCSRQQLQKLNESKIKQHSELEGHEKPPVAISKGEKWGKTRRKCLVWRKHTSQEETCNSNMLQLTQKLEQNYQEHL